MNNEAEHKEPILPGVGLHVLHFPFQAAGSLGTISTANGARATQEENLQVHFDIDRDDAKSALEPSHQGGRRPNSSAAIGRRIRHLSTFHVKVAVYVFIYGTILVAALLIYAAVTTGSLSLFVTMAESCCEAFSNIGLNYLHKKSEQLTIQPGGPRAQGASATPVISASPSP